MPIYYNSNSKPPHHNEGHHYHDGRTTINEQRGERQKMQKIIQVELPLMRPELFLQVELMAFSSMVLPVQGKLFSCGL